VAASTQNQALSAIVFLYKAVLKNPLDWLDDLERAKRPAKFPLVLSKEEPPPPFSIEPDALWQWRCRPGARTR
jgi:hypothetical protein